MNYPTEALKRWIDGDASRMLLISTQADAALAEVGEAKAISYVASQLSARYTMNADRRAPSLYGSLIDWSISQVDWEGLARLYVEHAYQRAANIKTI